MVKTSDGGKQKKKKVLKELINAYLTTRISYMNAHDL